MLLVLYGVTPTNRKQHHEKQTSLLIAGSLLFALTGLVPVQAAVDEEAAQALLKKSDGFKCHAIDKKKDSPPYKEVAEKYNCTPHHHRRSVDRGWSSRFRR